MTRVFPLPAPARTRRGPSVRTTASRWAGLSPARRGSVALAPPVVSVMGFPFAPREDVAPPSCVSSRRGRNGVRLRAPGRPPPARAPAHPRDGLAEPPGRSHQRGGLLVAQRAQARRGEPRQRPEAGILPAAAGLAEDLGQAIGERAIGRRPVAVLVRQLLLPAGLQDDGEVRPPVPEGGALPIVRPVGEAPQR